MIGLVATLRVNEGDAERFEDAMRDLMALVRAEEPGCLVYQLTKSRTEANTYKMLELYQDQASLDAHAKTDTARAAFAKMGGCLAGKPDLEFLDAVV